MLYAGSHRLIHVLRSIENSSHRGVLNRTWKLKGDIPTFEMLFEGFVVQSPLFPEIEAGKEIVVSGVRLMERVALMYDFEDNILTRCDEDNVELPDLIIKLHLGAPIVVETCDPLVFDTLYDFFELTSSDSHKSCFI